MRATRPPARVPALPVAAARGLGALALAVLTAGCAAQSRPGEAAPRAAVPGPAPHPPRIPAGAAFHPAVTGSALRGLPVRGMRCARRSPARFGVHLELFAGGSIVLLPAGIGIARPWRRRGPYVVGGRCSYPLRTREPTGVVEVAADRRHTLADLFALLGRPLTARRLVSFPAPPGREVMAFVDGRRRRGSPGSIPLRRHAQVVLEVAGYVAPHPSYPFPRGL